MAAEVTESWGFLGGFILFWGFLIAVLFQGFCRQSLSVLILQTDKNLGGNPGFTEVECQISIGFNGPGIHQVTT